MASVAERPAHARRPSHEYEDIPTTLSSSSSLAAPSPIPRVQSTPGSSQPASLSASPGRRTFASPPTPITITPSHSHSRKLSMNDAASSPFRSSFSVVPSASTASTSNGSLANGGVPLVAVSAHARKHSRIHSRNLSIYFPRPGANPTPSIAEDGAQEVETPVTIIPSPDSASLAYRNSNRGHDTTTPQSATFSVMLPPPKRLGEGFTFGGKPPPNSGGLESIPISNSTSSQSSSGPSARRGHHHKHSLSHNFFSFMEPSPSLPPASSPSATFPTSPSNTNGNATSPSWGAISPIPSSAPAASTAFPSANVLPDKPAGTLAAASLPVPSTSKSSSIFGQIMSLPSAFRTKLAFSCVESTIGALLWISGQQNGSLSCTGLGYWVVFDAIGVALTVYGELIRRGGHRSIKLPYGSQRMEVVGLFAQVVFLIFSAVYVCKETVEHLLLTSSDSHHHHRTDEYEKFIIGVDFPTVLLVLSSMMIALASLFFGNHFKLVDATGNFVPSPSSLLRSIRYQKSSAVARVPSLSTNPFSLNPLVFALCVLATDFWVAVDQQRPADLFLAAIEVLFTLWVAYPAVVALAKVLLQTAPDRGMPGGQMEALLRVMREIERHPNVLHLPAPHVWQLTAPSHTGLLMFKSRAEEEHKHDQRHDRPHLHSHTHSPQANGHTHDEHRRPIGGSGPSLIVTIQLHVDKHLEDVECLELTRWAWERCVRALGQGEEGVTVGIVRG